MLHWARAWGVRLHRSYHALGQGSSDLLDVIHSVDPQGNQGLCDVLSHLGSKLLLMVGL